MTKNIVVLIMLLMALAMGRQTIPATTITWTNTSGGNWSGAVNWSPHQVPTNTDVVLITASGTYTVTFDQINLGSAINANSVTLGAGSGSGAQTFLLPSGCLLAASSLVLVTNGGVLSVTNGTVLANNVQIDRGGVFNGNGETVANLGLTRGTSLIVANGGVMTSVNGTFIESATVITNGSQFHSHRDSFSVVTVANGGLLTLVNGTTAGLTVNSGGELDMLPSPANENPGFVSANGPIVNAGIITTTNAALNFYNVGLSNLPGGVIYLQGSSIIGVNGSGTFVNQGGVIEGSGPGSTINFLNNFDNHQGTVTNLAGTLIMGTFQTNLAGIYHAAVGATNQFIGANNVTPLIPGTPFVLAGGGQHQLIAGFFSLPSVAYPKLALIGTSLVLGPGFQGGAITNLSLNGIALSNSLTVAGQFSAMNSSILGNFTIAGGGVFTGSNFTTYGNVNVASGGVFNANGGTEGSSGSLAVANGGVLNIGSQLNLFGSLTNNGAINLTNSPVNFSGNGTGILNQPGGSINFLGNGAGIFGPGSSEYFYNRGLIFENAPGGTNTINLVQNLNLVQGTTTNLAGTLVLENFQTNLAGTFYTASGATTQLIGGTPASPLAPGTPLVFAGGGKNQFQAGCLFLPTNIIPGLVLLGGTLELGAGFQGGAITNLVIGGMTLTNSFPINGTFIATNYSLLYGNFTVASGGVFDCYGADMFGNLTVANGGLITVAGEGGLINPGSALSIAVGATMNITGSTILLNGPLTNAGTINITYAPSIFTPFPYSGIFSYNDGSGAFLGGVLNQASGLINLAGDSTEVGIQGGGNEYLINQGRITKTTGTNYSFVEAPLTTNSGAITAESGKIVIWPLVTKIGGSLNVVLNSAANYGAFLVYSPGNLTTVSTNMVLGGAFNATLNNGYVPANGTSFNVVSVLSPDTYSGNFSSLGLPSAVNWQSSYGSTNFTLLAGSGSPEFGGIHLVGTNLIFNGTGGIASSNYVVFVSTNVALPLTSWTALTTNKFDSSGQFRYTNHVNPAKPRQFFIFNLP